MLLDSPCCVQAACPAQVQNAGPGAAARCAAVDQAVQQPPAPLRQLLPKSAVGRDTAGPLLTLTLIWQPRARLQNTSCLAKICQPLVSCCSALPVEDCLFTLLLATEALRGLLRAAALRLWAHACPAAAMAPKRPRAPTASTPAKRAAKSSVAAASPLASAPTSSPALQRPTHVAQEAARLPGGRPWSAARRQALEKVCPTLDPTSYAVNADHWADLDDAWDLIMASPVFQGVPQEEPLEIVSMTRKTKVSGDGSAVEGGHIQPFSTALCLDAMATRGVYTCGSNLLWATPFYTPLPGVPINRQGAHVSNCFRRNT